MRTHKIVSADYHRNGVGGTGFYVALVDTIEDGETHRYLCIDMTGTNWSDEYASEEEARDDGWTPDQYQAGSFAVLRVDQISADNIGMHPVFDPVIGERQPNTGGAAYRGSDMWGAQLRQPIRDWWNESTMAGFLDAAKTIKAVHE